MAHEIGFSRLFSNRFEKSIYNSIRTWFPEARVFHNCALPWKNGEVTEADLIVVTRCGFYVLECKNYSGSVSNEDGKWVHSIEDTGFCKRYNDPFYQNNNHIRCLRKLFGLDASIPVFSMVVFADKTDISKVAYDYPLRTVVQGKDGVREMLACIEESQDLVLSDELVAGYSGQLDCYEPKNEAERLSNVRRIRGQRK